MIDIDAMEVFFQNNGKGSFGEGAFNHAREFYWPQIAAELLAGRKLRAAYHMGYVMANIDEACAEFDKAVQ